ncbi:uncharacterized protein LOC132178157 [Corylus avellana]|uniref:uncharacterized protein LOC132178157 n=1 Tax=Corylus avellana TaxID=13451 RepID=UPI00286B4BF5|nr:uncharacterized protein LOC132178157 [Corylus avellana]
MTHAANPWQRMSCKMEESKKSLMHWQREEVEKPNWAFVEQCKKLAVLQGAEIAPDVEKAIELQKDLKILMEQEDLKWRQRAKTDWLKFGDQNSKFFHACASQRRKETLYIMMCAWVVWKDEKRFPCEAFYQGRNSDCSISNGSSKSPWTYGFNAGFFQKHWDIVGPESAFIIGRLISNNILAAYETLYTMHMRMRGKKGYMAVKIDMSKAYDRMEWGFLEAVMGRMDFALRWIQLAMMCVTSAHCAVLVNGIPMGRIIPTWGIRQGDPISPYLFLICVEALSSSLLAVDRESVLEGVPTSRRGP